MNREKENFFFFHGENTSEMERSEYKSKKNFFSIENAKEKFKLKIRNNQSFPPPRGEGEGEEKKWEREKIKCKAKK